MRNNNQHTLANSGGGNKQKAYLALAGTSIIWGTTWVASRVGVQHMPGLQLSYLRQFISGAILLIFFLIKGEKLPTWQQFKWLALLSVFMFVLANGLSSWCVKYISSGLASLISALYPLCVVIIEMIFYKKRNNSPLTIIGLIIGIIGVAVVFYENAFHEQPAGYGFGVLLGFLAMFGWTIGTILVSRNKYQMNPYYALGWQMFISSFIIFIAANLTGNTIPLSDIPYQSWLAIAYLVSMGSLIAFMAFIYSIKNLPPAISSLYAYINPLVAMLVGALLLNEPLTTYIIAGACITLFGVYLVNYSIKKMK